MREGHGATLIVVCVARAGDRRCKVASRSFGMLVPAPVLRSWHGRKAGSGSRWTRGECSWRVYAAHICSTVYTRQVPTWAHISTFIPPGSDWNAQPPWPKAVLAIPIAQTLLQTTAAAAVPRICHGGRGHAGLVGPVGWAGLACPASPRLASRLAVAVRGCPLPVGSLAL